MYKTVDINETIKENVGLVYKVLNEQYSDKKYTFAKEDMVQIGLLALYKAIQSFDESREVAFSTLAITIIKNDLYKFITRDYKGYSGVLDDTVTSLDTSSTNEYSSTLKDRLETETDFSNLEMVELLEYIREHKSEKVVKMVFLLSKGYTYEETGKRIGCSKQYVSASMQKLAEELNSSKFIAHQIIKRK